MASVSKKLYVLMWKCLITRKRKWLLSTIELAFPVLIIYLTCKVLDTLDKADLESTSYGDFESYDPTNILTEPLVVSVAYSPSNNFTDDIMTKLCNGSASDIDYITRSCSGQQDNTSTPEAKLTEADLELWLKKQTLIDESAVGIVFLETNQSTNTFMYKIRSNDEDYFKSAQNAIDIELLKSAGVTFKEGYKLMKQFPTPREKLDKMIKFTLLYVSVMFAYLFLAASLVKDVIQEKASGIKELVKILGVPTWMIWTHWLIDTLMIHLPVSVIITILLTTYGSLVIPDHFLIYWLLLFLFLINCIALLFVVTCLFNNSTTGVTLTMLGWCILHALFLHYIVNNPSEIGYVYQILCCFVPLNNFIWSLSTIKSFDDIGVEWSIKHLFSVGSTGSEISVGLAIVIFILSTMIFTLIFTYLDAIKPGPYGVEKPLDFCFQWCKNLLWTSTRASSFVRYSLPNRFESPPRGAKVSFEIRGLQKQYGLFKKVTAVENVDLDIYEGEIMVVLGHNGAGKTTTMSMITGMFSPTKGYILFDGEDIYSGQSKYRESLGLCTQHNLYFNKLTVIEHLIFFGMLKGMSPSEAKVKGLQLLNSLNISEKKNSKACQLSGGMKRRLCLSVSLVGNPKVLILDEPTSGLDPENRRLVWNVLLSMRGQRTIIISTQFMEEADVLGDRIAIMGQGQVFCCGTTMFLKKIYSTGYQVHVLKESKSAVKDITSVVRQYVPSAQTKIIGTTQVDFIIEESFIKRFPSLMSALESQTNSLGITGITVTCTSMEDVFLKVAETSSQAEEEQTYPQKPSESRIIINHYNKMEGLGLLCQRLKVLFWKGMIYHYRHITSHLICLLITSLLVLMIAGSIHLKPETVPDPIMIELSDFADSKNVIQFDDKNKQSADIAMELIRKQKGEVTILSEDTNIDEYLINMYRNDFSQYNHILVALQIIQSNFTMYYQNNYGSAFNLMSNIILRSFSTDNRGSIQVINHHYVIPRETTCTGYNSFMISIFVSFYYFTILTSLTSGAIPFLMEERVSGFKHQQYLTGLSPILYWLANFICDFFIYILITLIHITILLVLGGVIILDSFFGLLALVLFLYGISGLFFAYLFTYVTNSSALGTSLYLTGNLLCIIIYTFCTFKKTKSLLIRAISYFLYLNPNTTAIAAIYHIIHYLFNQYDCKYCEKETACKNHLELLNIEEEKDGVLLLILYLALSWVLYFFIIILIDCGFVRKLCLSFCYKKSTLTDSEEEDSDVEMEREQVKSVKRSGYKKIPLRVENLTKKYLSGPKAVKHVGFLLFPGDCFGLLGVNGAGKTTTFKILTGEIFPNSGDSFVFQLSVISNTRQYQKCIGYCPQFDSILNKLTGEETLKTIAQLKGIPQGQVKNETNRWLEMVGILEHAKKCTGTYSGGTKRKLSTAMAFIGDPVVVFLDEPTTGVDPSSRRKLWSVVKERQKAGQAIVLTSHSMEECEALCTRLTIMKAGRMKCIGTPEYLKNKFSLGYTVNIKLTNLTDSDLKKLKRDFTQTFPMNEIKDENMSLIQYQIQDPSIPLSQVFFEMLRLKEKHKIIEDFNVSNTNLEQIFLSFARNDST